MKARIVRGICASFSIALLLGCGGGGSTSDDAVTSNTLPPPSPPTPSCDSNKILVNGKCQCPAHLFDKNGYCIDWAESVTSGAEYLKPGFPVAVTLDGGVTFRPDYLKVGNIDKDSDLEIIFQPRNSPIWAWNPDASMLDGWPVAATTFQHSKIVLAQFDNDNELELFSGHAGTGRVGELCELNVFEFDGANKSGWPKRCGHSVDREPAAGDLDNDGVDEVVYIDGTNVNVIDGDGEIVQINIQNLPFGLNKWCGVSIADIDDNQTKDLILLSCPFPDRNSTSTLRRLYVVDPQSNVLSGFPVEFRSAYETQPLIGDVDGDGIVEIVVAAAGTLSQFQTDGILSSIKIISDQGMVQSEINFNNWLGDGHFHYLSLTDIDLDGTPEILAYENGKIHAFDSMGVERPGWPIEGGPNFSTGDIDGDQVVDIITFEDYSTNFIFDNRANLVVYGNDGLLKHNKITIDYMGRDVNDFMMPVIQDLDLDGKNEVIVAGLYWEGVSGVFPQVWAFNFDGASDGGVEWGQMFGNERNSGEYKSVP